MSFTKLAIVGTAGRKEDQGLLTSAHWDRMMKAVTTFLTVAEIDPRTLHLVSGGAAWADHLAVSLTLRGLVPPERLHLFLPVNLEYYGYEGDQESDRQKKNADTANYYHKLFSHTTGVKSIDGLNEVRKLGAQVEICEGGFHARNYKVAKAVSEDGALLAFTSGSPKSDQPDWTIRSFNGAVKAGEGGLKDGGTAHTWDTATCPKFHARIGPILDGELRI